MGLVKTVALVVVAGAAGSMIAAKVTPLITSRSTAAAANAGAISTGVTAGSAAAVFVILSSIL